MNNEKCVLKTGFRIFGILFMFPLTLAPFLTKLKAIYRHDVILVTLFGSVFIFAGLILMQIWRYAVSHPEFLKNARVDPTVARSMQQRILMGPVVCLVAVGLSFISIDFGTIVFCMLPLFNISHRMVDIEMNSDMDSLSTTPIPAKTVISE